MDRLDVLVARKGKDDKTYWTRIGVAFPTKTGGGWNVYLDALPLDGKLTLFPPKPKEGAKQDLDDEIPPF